MVPTQPNQTSSGVRMNIQTSYATVSDSSRGQGYDVSRRDLKSGFAIKHSKNTKINFNESGSEAISDSQNDSFIEEIEKERKEREEKGINFDDSDEDDFLLPQSIKMKILQEREKSSKLK